MHIMDDEDEDEVFIEVLHQLDDDVGEALVLLDEGHRQGEMLHLIDEEVEVLDDKIVWDEIDDNELYMLDTQLERLIFVDDVNMFVEIIRYTVLLQIEF